MIYNVVIIKKSINQSKIIKKEQNNKEDKVPTTAPTKNNQYCESKTGERRERTVPNKKREQQNFSKNDSGDTKVEKRRETEIYGDLCRRQDDRRPRRRDREQPKRNDEPKAPVKSSAENWDSEINSRAEKRKGVQRENRDRQSDGTQDYTIGVIMHIPAIGKTSATNEIKTNLINVIEMNVIEGINVSEQIVEIVQSNGREMIVARVRSIVIVVMHRTKRRDKIKPGINEKLESNDDKSR
jgi:hypothetical protein